MAKVDKGDRARDYVMARAAGVLASLDASKNAILESIGLFIGPEDDSKGKERKDLFDAALEAASCAVRGLEDIETKLPDVDMSLAEPWEDDEDEDEEEDEKEEPRTRR